MFDNIKCQSIDDEPFKANIEVKAETQKMLFRFLHLHVHKNLI